MDGGSGLRLMRRHADRVIPTIEGDELRFEHDVAVDLERGLDGLETAETS